MTYAIKTPTKNRPPFISKGIAMIRNSPSRLFNARADCGSRRLSRSNLHSLKIGGFLTAALLSFFSTVFSTATIAQTTAAQPQPAVEVGVDASIKPGDDFFAYANGDWLKTTDIPAGRQRWSERNEIAERTRQQIASLLESNVTAPKGSTARKVADFQAAYLNRTAIEAKGLAPIKPLFEQINRVRDKVALTQLLGRNLRADVDPLNAGIYQSAHLLGLAVQASIHGEKNNVAFLLQGGLGLPDRTHYLSAEPPMQALRTQYLQYIGKLLEMADSGTANSASVSISTLIAKRADAVMALETAIAQSHATREASAEDRNADNVWTRADFVRQAPGMDWSQFFAAAQLHKSQSFVAWQPSAIKGVAALVAAQPLNVWKDYLRFHTIHSRADVLPQSIAAQARAVRVAATGQAVPTNDAQRAIDATHAAMREAIGRLYAERYFPAKHKAQVTAIAANVVAAFGRRLDSVTWMSPNSKMIAQAKLKTLYFGVGYPNKWQDDADLTIDTADALGNLTRIANRNYRRAIASLGKPIDQTAWTIAPQTPGAVLTFHTNAYNFAAALLQIPKFDPAATEATNYGAIGAIIGHEVSHFIDTLGAEYEPDGRMRRWWTAEDMSRYQAATQSLVNQYADYKPLPDQAINGKNTLVENLADLGGLAVAFDAYRRMLGQTVGSKINDNAYVRQQDRQFFIGYARSWRSKMSEEALRKYLTNDSHAPERYRIATVRNIDAWYEAFDVLPGDRLYLAPEARVRVW
jgi:putative endopeptidase